MMTSVLATIFILIFCMFQHISSHFEDIDLTYASDSELEKIQEYLAKQMSNIDYVLRRKKRSISPISSSLPNRESAGFLSRIGAIRKTIEENTVQNKTSENEITPTPLSENQDAPQADIPTKFESGKFQKINDSLTECKKLSQPELVAELKQKGTYNPELMAWDAIGVIRFLDRTLHEHYQKNPNPQQNNSKTKPKTEVIDKNVEALEKLMKELNVTCDIKSEVLRNKLQSLTFSDPRRTIISPSLRRSKRMDSVSSFLKSINVTVNEEYIPQMSDQPLTTENERVTVRQKLIGESHVVPFGCDKRGAEEDGYLRLCGACQAIRRLPDTFFPPFINEVTCDTDKACLYFYDYPHGKCRQKHMNFVVLRNVGTKECQVWKKFNLNVRVSCECFVDEMSFFAKYV
ncbi:unnamed protein product [Caenorhabditis angaria]|uniref:Spaetzle domain-containing protein n=1 Tax=Caenorhabditis angaria TaxID=860376 RepID=A0A9P1IYY4_9PELO|nr:unnamed protein product [Caenorhabditis angaria]